MTNMCPKWIHHGFSTSMLNKRKTEVTFVDNLLYVNLKSMRVIARFYLIKTINIV